MSLLQCNGLVKTFGGLLAIGGVDITIERGEVLGLIGPNGAGKTTFVNLLTGQFRLTAGTIIYNGQDISRLSPMERSQLGLARTFQVPKPFSSMTIGENIMVGMLFGKRDRSDQLSNAERLGQILDKTGLGAFANSYPSTLSTAGLKRLEVARSLAADPDLLFLDEPLGGLNPVETQDALNLIRSLRESGVTIVFIEHIIKAVTAVSDKIVVLSRGLKLAEGTSKEILANEDVRKAYLGDVDAALKRHDRPNRRRTPRPAGASA